MSEPEKNLALRWRAALSERELTRVDDACTRDPDLAHDLSAMLEGLSPKRRGPFMRRFSANLLEADSPQSALLLTLSDLGSTEIRNEGGEMTRFGDRPLGHSEP